MNGIAQKIIADPDGYSIDMLTQGVQNGTVPAYIGVPLIQEKMQAQKKQEALMGGMEQGNEPPIAQQILGEAAQSTGLEGLSTGLPVEGYAPGGIIAFADGGEADEDEEDDDDLMGMGEDEKQLFNILRSRMASGDEYEEMSGIGALPAGAAKAAMQSTKREVSSKVGNEPKQTRSEGITQLTKEGIAPESLINKIMQKESGGRRYDKDGNLLTSPKGAQGEMQVMPGTARDPGFGIRPARAGDPDDLARVGREYFNVMLDKYKDPKLAAIAYNWGPGNTDKWLVAGADPSKLPRETQKYSADMAAGGEVRHFQVGGINNPFDKYASPEIANQIGIIDQQINDADEEIKLFKNNQPPVGSREFMGWKQKLNESMARRNALEIGYKNLAEQTGAARPYLGNMMQQGTGVGKPPEILKTPPPVKLAQNKVSDTPIPQKMDMVNPDEASIAAEKAARYTPPTAGAAKAEEPALTNPMGDYIGEYASYLKDRKEQLGKDKETNKYLALLQAGLGMMGGTSRYAGANIGQGASQGIAAYMAGRKQESADDRAIQQGMLGLSRADLYNKMHLEDIKRKALADNNMKLFREADLAIKQQNANNAAAKNKLMGTRAAQEFNIKAEKSWKDSDDYTSLIKDLTSKKKDWKNDTKLREQYERGRIKFIQGYLAENQSGAGILDAEDA
jgi:hypothetical protein